MLRWPIHAVRVSEDISPHLDKKASAMNSALVSLKLFILSVIVMRFLSDPCVDGIMNYNETDVDCGGPLCDPCSVNQVITHTHMHNTSIITCISK